MYQHFKTNEAAANQSGAMDAGDHFTCFALCAKHKCASRSASKNGASSKSQMCRGNFLRKGCFAVATFTIIGLVSSCNSAKIFSSPDAKTLASKQQTLAIIPPTVSIAAKKNISAEALQVQQKTESLNFQNAIYSWMLNRKMKEKITVDIQDIETTNARLARAGYPETPMTTNELCETLGVNGIMTSNFALTKPMSEGAAIAVAVLLGGAAKTNRVQVRLGINDCENNKTIWSYEHRLSGGLGSSPSSIVNQLMKKASKKMPHVKK